MSAGVGSFFRGLFKVVLGALLAVAVLLGTARVFPTFDLPDMPFGAEKVDRSGPALLKSLTDLSDYRAASGYYETVVDLENDTKLLPSWVSGERVLYVGKGTVDAMVGFGDLGANSVLVSEDRRSVSVDLPEPTLGKPVLDIEKSSIYQRDSGLVTKFRGSELERDAQLKAIEQMGAAAQNETLLVEQAKKNTVSMLEGLFGSLGFTDIDITFRANPA
ncbi:DUF4230 domain-containing protein [Rothia sp. ARF10]|nr:DUF4230 domain-containing protein [Rothia sp. ARF10]